MKRDDMVYDYRLHYITLGKISDLGHLSDSTSLTYFSACLNNIITASRRTKLCLHNRGMTHRDFLLHDNVTELRIHTSITCSLQMRETEDA